jgi:hypothetical protein
MAEKEAYHRGTEGAEDENRGMYLLLGKASIEVAASISL